MLAKIDAFLGLLSKTTEERRSDTRYGCPNPDDPLIKIKRFSGFSNENQEERKKTIKRSGWRRIT